MITVRELVNLIGFKIDEAEFASAQKRMDGFQKSLATAGNKMLLGITLPFVGLVTAAVRAASKQDTATAQVIQAIQSTGGAANKTIEELLQSATRLQNETLFGDDDILGGVSASLLTFQNVTGEVFDKAQEAILDVTQRMSGANGGMQALHGTTLQLGKALNNPLIGLQALGRAGIQFTAEQKKEITNLVKSGQLQKAQIVMLDLIHAKFGGSAKAAAEASFGFKQLSNAFGDLLEVIGTSLKPILKPLSEWLKKITIALQNINPELISAILLIGGLAAAIGPLLIVLSSLIKAGMIIRTLFVSIKTVSMATGVSMGLMSLKFIAIAAAIAAVIAAITLLVEDFLVYKRGGKSFIGEMIKWWNKLSEVMGLKNIGEAWHEFFFNLGSWLHGFITDKWIPFWENAGAGLYAVIQKIGEWWDTIWDKIGWGLDKMKIVVDALQRFSSSAPAITDFDPELGGKNLALLERLNAPQEKTIKIDATVNTYVPEGTTAQATESIRKTAEDVYSVFMSKLTRQLSYSVPMKE